MSDISHPYTHSSWVHPLPRVVREISIRTAALPSAIGKPTTSRQGLPIFAYETTYYSINQLITIIYRDGQGIINTRGSPQRRVARRTFHAIAANTIALRLSKRHTPESVQYWSFETAEASGVAATPTTWCRRRGGVLPQQQRGVAGEVVFGIKPHNHIFGLSREDVFWNRRIMIA